MKRLFAFLTILIAIPGWAQQSFPEKTDDVLVNRQLLNDALANNIQDQLDNAVISNAPQKSIGKSVLMSAVLPGAGQFYANSYIKSAIFLAAEAVAWGMYVSYNKKGDDQTDKFEAFANQNWTEQRYWTFVYTYVQSRYPDVEGFPYGQYDAMVEDAAGRLVIPDWQTAEEDLKEFASSQYISGFSHDLPSTTTQQYYEMIGKYPEQFGNGWADATYTDRYQGGYGDPSRENVTVMNKNYVGMRNEANQFYDKAAYGTMIALVNHVISAIDAGFTTRRFNQRQMQLTYNNRRLNGEYVNMFGLAVEF